MTDIHTCIHIYILASFLGSPVFFNAHVHWKILGSPGTRLLTAKGCSIHHLLPFTLIQCPCIHGRLVYYVSIFVATQCMYMIITQGCPICCTLLFYLYLYRHVCSPGLFHFCCTFVFMLSTHVFSLSHIINFTLVQCTGMVCTCIHICSRLVCHTLYYLCLL